MELDNNESYETINEWIDDVLSKNSNKMMSEESNYDASSEKSISDKTSSKDNTLSEELDYEYYSSERSNNSKIISNESDNCVTNKKGSNKIVDKPLSKEQMLFINREFVSSFNNITEALIFSTHAYDKLVDIIHHPQFKSTDVMKNIQRFRKYRQRLLLPSIRSQYIHIFDKKILSTSRKTKEMYYLSITEII
ncbi:18344_t:CDS:2, partial [Racocetra persica]